MDKKVRQAVEALIEHFGGQVATAKAIGVKQPTVSAWLNEGHGVSAKSAIRAEQATGKAILATDLCPDLLIKAA